MIVISRCKSVLGGSGVFKLPTAKKTPMGGFIKASLIYMCLLFVYLFIYNVIDIIIIIIIIIMYICIYIYIYIYGTSSRGTPYPGSEKPGHRSK